MMDDTLDFYEGAEKLLEMWFEPLTSSDDLDVKWLRTISRYTWTGVSVIKKSSTWTSDRETRPSHVAIYLWFILVANVIKRILISSNTNQ